jgi:hypothetical protein
LATAKFLTHFIISIAVLENLPLSRVTEKSNFSTLNVGLAGTGNRTQNHLHGRQRLSTLGHPLRLFPFIATFKVYAWLGGV